MLNLINHIAKERNTHFLRARTRAEMQRDPHSFVPLPLEGMQCTLLTCKRPFVFFFSVLLRVIGNFVQRRHNVDGCADILRLKKNPKIIAFDAQLVRSFCWSAAWNQFKIYIISFCQSVSPIHPFSNLLLFFVRFFLQTRNCTLAQWRTFLARIPSSFGTDYVLNNMTSNISMVRSQISIWNLRIKVRPFFSFPLFSAPFRWFYRRRGLHLLLLQRNCRGIHQLRKGTHSSWSWNNFHQKVMHILLNFPVDFFSRRTTMQEWSWRWSCNDPSVPEQVDDVPKGKVELLSTRRYALLLQRDPSRHTERRKWGRKTVKHFLDLV